MKFISKTYTLKVILIVTLILLLYTGIVFSSDVTDNKKEDVIRFDTVLELKSPASGTNVLLFTRYWVSKNFYSIGFKWAEPQVGNLNFPTNPGVTINSDEKEFSTSSQVIESHNVKFPKPIEDRGVFRSALGSYPFANIRFAEPESLISRVYKKDLANVTEPNNEQVQTIEIKDLKDSQGITRIVKKLTVKKDKGNIDNLKIFDANGFLLKDINYEYASQDGNSVLKRENVLMPEKRMMVGFNGSGVTITLRGQKRTYKELPGFHHTGARKCDIKYETIKTSKGALSAPSSIVVKRADANYTLRTARMSNFTQLKMTSLEAQKEALEFGRLSENELEVRALLEKYWLKKPSDINDTDAKQLAQLRRDFKNKNSADSSIPDKLRNTGMLLDLDWIQADPNLFRDFEQYLVTLKKNNFNQMILPCGLNVIDWTVRWSRYSDADKLMQTWLENAVPLFNPIEILSFSDGQIQDKKYWVTVKLLESYHKSNSSLGAERFDIQAMRCLALNELKKLIDDPSKLKQDSIRSQVDWVLNSMKKEDFDKITNDSLIEAQKSFSDLKEPNKIQLSQKKKLDQIEGKISQDSQTD